jgi:acetylornithine deacetylase/succinyl-diaminopimelate desuccinylase-like protein
MNLTTGLAGNIARLVRAITLVVFVWLSSALLVAQPRPSPQDEEHRAIFRELVEINTSADGGSVAPASRAVAVRLAAAGYAASDVDEIGPDQSCVNVLATLRGRDPSLKPILLLAHLDVVPAKRSDWQHDPYVLREDNGWFVGRGTLDNKAGASVLVSNMVRWKREGFVPARDVIMVLTCDEETTAERGMIWLLANRSRLGTAEYALNTDAGGVEPRAAGRASFWVQAAEKAYVTFTFTARNAGGHSSVPRADNAVYALAAALGRLAAFRFPVQYNEVSQRSFARAADLESGQLADDLRAASLGATDGPAIERLSAIPYINSDLRTTCVATMLTGGHAENALPQSATATVNCRVFPGVPEAEIKRQLEAVVADATIGVTTAYPMTASTASPLRDDVMTAVDRLANRYWPGAVVVPGMSAGATDGLYLRNIGVPVFGVGAIEIAPDDERSHGLDERVPVRSLFRAREFWYELIETLAARR